MSRVTSSARDCQLANSFEEVRATLLADGYRDRLAKPLAYWTLPNDRRLPLALLNRSLGELLNTPFEELAATPGIGQKKISSLISLLRRATSDSPPTVPLSGDVPGEAQPAAAASNIRFDQSHGFNAYLVSEALWSQWTALVRELGLGDEPIGRVADSLNAIPTVIWQKRLEEYENLTLSQIRSLRTHGEKRVRCVLQVFHKVYESAIQYREHGTDHLRRQLGSQRILAVSEWIQQKLRQDAIPQPDEVRAKLANPILAQIETDCGDTMYKIACQRLGIEGDTMSVRAQAQAMGVTRARVYQLLDDCHRVLDVRWPRGKDQLDMLTAKMGSQLGLHDTDASLFLAVRQLCFPERTTVPNSSNGAVLRLHTGDRQMAQMHTPIDPRPASSGMPANPALPTNGTATSDSMTQQAPASQPKTAGDTSLPPSRSVEQHLPGSGE